MRNHVSFRCPETFTPVSEESDGILSVEGARWFAALLRRVPDIQLDEELCQEDWGVVFFASRNNRSFWIGLSAWDGDHSWLAHLHHGSFAWLQMLSRSGGRELHGLIEDVDHALTTDPQISDVAWYREKDMNRGDPQGSRSPAQT